MSATIANPTVIDRAEMILRDVKATTWPSSPEAMAAVGYAWGYGVECTTIHARLLSGDLGWQDYDADLMFLGGGEESAQREAISIAADRALDAARAALRMLREYQRRGAMAAAHAERRAAA